MYICSENRELLFLKVLSKLFSGSVMYGYDKNMTAYKGKQTIEYYYKIVRISA